MKRHILKLLILGLALSAPIEVTASGGFGGKKILRKANRKSKKLQRKNGIGQVEFIHWKEVVNG